MMYTVLSSLRSHLDGLAGPLAGWRGGLLETSYHYHGQKNLLGVEGLYSQSYGKGVFVFLVVSLLIFVGIMYLYWQKSKTSLKRGEMVMFGAIMMGVVFAFVFGYIQMVQGYLF